MRARNEPRVNPSTANSTTSPASAPAGRPSRLSPAESSKSRPWRAPAMRMRRARERSGVTTATERPGVSTTERRMSATTSASSLGSAASISSRSARAARPRPFWPGDALQWKSVSGGRIISRRSQRRLASGADATSSTRDRSRASSAKSWRMANCGCWGPTAAQLASSSSRSRPGNTTQPCSEASADFIRARVAGTVPVEPAMMMGPASVRVSSSAARRRSLAERAAVSLTRPREWRAAGSSFRTWSRKPTAASWWWAASPPNRFESSRGSMPSISSSSRNRATLPASATACLGEEAISAAIRYWG